MLVSITQKGANGFCRLLVLTASYVVVDVHKLYSPTAEPFYSCLKLPKFIIRSVLPHFPVHNGAAWEWCLALHHLLLRYVFWDATTPYPNPYMKESLDWMSRTQISIRLHYFGKTGLFLLLIGSLVSEPLCVGTTCESPRMLQFVPGSVNIVNKSIHRLILL